MSDPAPQGYVLHLRVDDLPRLQVAGSGRGSVRSRIRETRRWRDDIAWLARAHGVPSSPLCTARVRFVRHSSLRPDYTNLVASFKAIEDGLVRAGVLSDDSFAVIGQAEFAWEKASPRAGFIEIFVESV